MSRSTSSPPSPTSPPASRPRSTGKDGKALADAKKAVEATIARECSGGDANIRCDVVELYHGGIYNLYRYRRYQDVRLVFAPEMAIAFFGGDPDNFEFPRYDLDVTYLRVYDDDRPLDTAANFLRYATTDARPGDLTFTSGHPGRTDRLDTVAELEFERDVTLPRGLFYDSELRGILTEFSARGPEQARIAKSMLFGIENSLKARKGRFAALVDPAIIKARAASEEALRAQGRRPIRNCASNTARPGTISARRSTTTASMRDRYDFTEGGQGFRSRLFGFAKTLVRHAAEAHKPDEERLREYTNANFPIQRQALASAAPIYPELEKLTLTFSLTKLREALGPDDPFVAKVLGNKSPAALAAELVDGTGLADVASCARACSTPTRPRIAAVRRSDDRAARNIDPELRAHAPAPTRTRWQARLTKNSALIANAMFKIYGTSTYPDATFTLRFSYGTVKGYRQNGREHRSDHHDRRRLRRARPAPIRSGCPTAGSRHAARSTWRQPFNFATDQRHHRRQFRLAGDQQGGRGGRPHLRRQHPVARRRIRLRPGTEPRRRGRRRRAARGADQGLSRGPAGGGIGALTAGCCNLTRPAAAVVQPSLSQ